MSIDYELAAWGDGGINPIPLGEYPDGMPLIQCDMIERGEPFRILVRPRSLRTFMAAMFYMDALHDRGGKTPHLVLPLVPGSRQDRLNSTGDYLFTARSIAFEVGLRHFPSVTILDPHSDVTSALIDRCRVISAADCMNVPPDKYAAVISPDAGAEKRASSVAKKLGVPLLHGWKQRDVRTGELCGFGLEPHGLPRGSLILVVDDLCDGGGTFIGLADVLDAAGLKAHLWVTHGLFTKGTGELLKRYGHVYCTDSVIGPREGIIEIPICEKILKGELC